MYIIPTSIFIATAARRQAMWFVLACFFTLLVAACSGDESSRLKIGDRAPAFSIVDLQGQAITSDNWQGSPMILRFWDTECKYCRADSPIINSYFDTYREQGLKVLYVATANETIERVKAYIEELDIGFPVALDKDGTMARDYQVSLVPQTIFISPDQKIITAVLGGVGEAELQELLGPYLP
ncbi:MAG: TlpA family protein disulfide reductase [Desulfobulbaceae bacterium]|nr:MAG: TlpA family protein disulfide reductase [Desulfobulbaceae bacterium]